MEYLPFDCVENKSDYFSNCFCLSHVEPSIRGGVVLHIMESDGELVSHRLCVGIQSSVNVNFIPRPKLSPLQDLEKGSEDQKCFKKKV